MFNIMDFPDEILLRIAYETLPDGIEALSKCCKRLSIVSRGALDQHEAYQNEYEDIQITRNEGAGPLLMEVVRNPRCAEYIRHADFNNCCKDVRVPLDRNIVPLLTRIMAKIPCISLPTLPLWVREATSGDHDLIIAMLLFLLPRLESLAIPPATRLCEMLVRSAAQWFQNPSFYRRTLPLTRLTNLAVGNDELNRARPGQYFVEHGIKLIEGLPSLRSLSCSFRTTRALSPNIMIQLCNGSTSLHIFDLDLSTEDLEIILGHVRNLTAFTYIDRYLSSAVRNLDATLQKHAGDSLEKLRLLCEPSPNLQLPNHGFTSLRGFTVLKEVTMPLHTIRTLYNRSSSRPTSIEFLPASVEELVIFDVAHTGLGSQILDELAEAKEAHFPRLKNFHMSHNPNHSRTRVASENGGIILELDEEDEEEGEHDEIAPMEESE